MEIWQVGLAMALTPVLVALVLLVPLAFTMAGQFYKGMFQKAMALAFQRRGEVVA